MKIDIERLILCREKLGISKQAASKRIGLSQPAYLRYESGERNPSPQMLKEIARALHTSVDYLVGTTDDPSPNAFEVRRDEDEELFLVVERAVNFDQMQKKRLLKYTEKIANNTHSE